MRRRSCAAASSSRASARRSRHASKSLVPGLSPLSRQVASSLAWADCCAASMLACRLSGLAQAASSKRVALKAAAKEMRDIMDAVQHANCDLAKAAQVDPRPLAPSLMSDGYSHRLPKTCRHVEPASHYAFTLDDHARKSLVNTLATALERCHHKKARKATSRLLWLK